MSRETGIKERPIIFKAEMVNAILEGRKTQTRRIMKYQPTQMPDLSILSLDRALTKKVCVASWFEEEGEGSHCACICSYGKPGDRLWVRETFADIGPRLTFRADLKDGAHCKVKRWTPSIFMPRCDSRIQLEITDIRVERLNDISGDDAKAEGVEWEPLGWIHYGDSSRRKSSSVQSFQTLWESINGPNSFDDKWIWVIEFKMIENAAGN